jgi:5'-phosphate synthase pdxT subunit
VGVLSVQGDFARHAQALESLGVAAVRVSLPKDLEGVEALVMPGGESTAMLRLLESTGLRTPLEKFVQSHPVLGTCAGVILLGVEADGLPAPPLAVLDIGIERNAYGRQIDSFSGLVEAPALGAPFQGVFIRAPRIRRVGSGVEIVARRADGPSSGEPVGVRVGRVVGLCFHPELTPDLRFHRWFLRDVAELPIAPEAPAPTSNPARHPARGTPSIHPGTPGASR